MSGADVATANSFPLSSPLARSGPQARGLASRKRLATCHVVAFCFSLEHVRVHTHLLRLAAACEGLSGCHARLNMLKLRLRTRLRQARLRNPFAPGALAPDAACQHLDFAFTSGAVVGAVFRSNVFHITLAKLYHAPWFRRLPTCSDLHSFSVNRRSAGAHGVNSNGEIAVGLILEGCRWQVNGEIAV